MKTKEYVLTEIEILAIRDALEELKFVNRNLRPSSPVIIERNKAVVALHAQFKADYAKI